LGAAPQARAFHGMAYDSARGVHVMYGGSEGSSILGDTWEYDGAARTWTMRGPLGPGPGDEGPGRRFWFQLVFDAEQNNTLLYGGTRGDVTLGDTWTWNGEAGAWTLLQPLNRPKALQLYAAAYDSLRKVVLLFGGSRFDDRGLASHWESW